MELIKTYDWYFTSRKQPRGYIDPHTLRELWIHTGTACNLACPFCLEGSHPGDKRLEPMLLDDLKSYFTEAVNLGVERFSFTGGEPFVIRDFVRILDFASALRPCLVLTNGTDPLLKRVDEIAHLVHQKHPISFRVSLDSPDASIHDAGRGPGTFDKSLEAVALLHGMGFRVSIARQADPDEDAAEVDSLYQRILRNHGVPEDLPIVAFPDFHPPHSSVEVPEITENCMTQYQTEENRRNFMCAFSKMLVKQQGKINIYACTLVDDDPRYSHRGSLTDSLKERVMLGHHRCYSCFAFGATCSES